MGIRSICRRTAGICCEIFAVIAVLLVFIAGIALWRLAAEPVSMNYMRPYIENALSNPATGYRSEIRDIWLKWNAFEGPPVLQVDALDVFKDKHHIVRVASGDIAFSPWPLIYGAFEPVGITVTGPEIRVMRSGTGAFRLDLAGPDAGPAHDGDEAAPKAMSDTQFIRRILEFLSGQADSGAPSPLSSLARLEIRNGTVLVVDHKKGMTWRIPDFDIAARRQDKGLVINGHAALNPGVDGASLRVDSLYKPQAESLHGQLSFTKFPLSLIARFLPGRNKLLRAQTMRLNGQLDFKAQEGLMPDKARLSLSLGNGAARLALPGIYETPVTIGDLDLQAALNRDKKQFSINRLALSYAGLPIELRARGGYSYKDGVLTLTAPVNFASSAMPIADIAAVWPKMARDDPAYEWFGKKLESGRLRNIGASAKLTLTLDGGTPALEAEAIKASGSFEDMHVDYRPPLIPGKNVHGGFDFAGNTLRIAIKGGTIGDMAVQSGSVKSTKVLNEGEGQAFIDLSLAGPLRQVMAYVARKPIEAGDLLDVPREAVKGAAELDVSLQFPTLPDVPIEKISTKVEGTLRDVVLPGLINDLDVTGGPITVKGEDGRLNMAGAVKLAGRDVTFEWTRYLQDRAGEAPYLSRIEASLTSDAGLRQAFDLRLEDYIAGALPLELAITEHEADRLDVDLTGDLSPVRLSIDALDYMKPQGASGSIEAGLTVRNENLHKIDSLSMEAPALDVENAQLTFTPTQTAPRLTSGRIERLRINATSTRVAISRADDGRLVLDLEGQTLDARPFLGPGRDESTTRTPMIIKGDVARMRTTDDREISDVKLYIEVPAKGFLDQLEMDARAGDKAIYLRYKPDDETGRRKLMLDAGNAGAFMRAFDVYENMRGGVLKVRADATNPGQENVLAGELVIRDFEVFDAPVLARLLNALSLSGMQELLRNDGISFTKLQSDMRYITRGDKRVIRFDNGRTSGSALGLTFEGEVDQANDTLDIKGTIVPASNVNRFLSRIPVLGKVLAGDEGDGVFAATYTIKGDAKKTKITINPLSVLAPGILRKIFFE